MDIKNITKLAQQFNKAIYDSESRDLIINKSPIPNGMSFSEAANMVIEDLHKIDPEGQDPAILNAIHGLMDVLGEAAAIPQGQKLLAAVAAANLQVQSKAKKARQKNMSKYLVALTNIIIMKFYQNKKPAQQGVGQEQPGQQSGQTKMPTGAPPPMSLNRKYEV